MYYYPPYYQVVPTTTIGGVHFLMKERFDEESTPFNTKQREIYFKVDHIGLVVRNKL